jgi:hypothetical protein
MSDQSEIIIINTEQPTMDAPLEQVPVESSLDKHLRESSYTLKDLIHSQKDTTNVLQFLRLSDANQQLIESIEAKNVEFPPIIVEPSQLPTLSSQKPASVFDQVARAMASSSLQEAELCPTWNGAAQYTQVGKDIVDSILGLCNKLVQDPYVSPKGKGTKRKGQPKAKKNPIDKLSSSHKQMIESTMTTIVGRIKSLPEGERAIHFDLLWRMVFVERAISNASRVAEGKGSKDMSFYIFYLLSQEFPETAKNLVALLPHYGSFKDINALIALYQAVDPANEIINSLSLVYANAIDKDLRSILCTGLFDTPHSELNTRVESLHHEVMEMSPLQIRERFKGISLAGKWFPRPATKYGNEKARNATREKNHKEALPDKRERPYDSQIPLLMKALYGEIKDDLPTRNFYSRLHRKLINTLSRITGTVEQLMSTKRWDLINPKTVPGAAFFQHRMGFLNQLVGEEGSRTEDPLRIALRERCLEVAEKGELSFSGDSVKFAQECKKYRDFCIGAGRGSGGKTKLTDATRLTLDSQFNSLVENVRSILQKDYTEKLELWQTNGSNPSEEPISPFNSIATVDVSSSMGERMFPAIVLGLIVSSMSNLGRLVLTFDTIPRIIPLDDKGFCDNFVKVANAPWGGSTNIEAANELLIKIIQGVRRRDPSFNPKRVFHVIFSDMQFNPSCCEVRGLDGWEPFAEKMKKRFTSEGLELPITTFWNMNGNTSGFPCESTSTGMQMAEGLSQGLLLTALGGGVKYVVDEATGETVVKTNPSSAFLKRLAHPDYLRVSDVVYRTREGSFADVVNVARCQMFHAQSL